MVVEGEQRLLRVDDGVELWSARSGRSDADLVVLLAGAAMSSQIWDTGLRPKLVSAGLSVLTVEHGTDDPMFPIEHARALVKTIPEAELEVRPGRGHELFADREIHQLIASHLVRGNLIE